MSKIEKPVKKPTGYDMKDWADNDYLQENIDALVYCKDIRWEKYIEQSDKYWEQEMKAFAYTCEVKDNSNFIAIEKLTKALQRLEHKLSVENIEKFVEKGLKRRDINCTNCGQEFSSLVYCDINGIAEAINKLTKE